MEDDQRKEVQFLFTESTLTQVSYKPYKSLSTSPELDLSLSMNIGQPKPNPSNNGAEISMRSIQAYVERVRDLTRRELELAQKDFERARMIWERAREDMEKVERMKAGSTRRLGPSCIEITCQACRQRFQP